MEKTIEVFEQFVHIANFTRLSEDDNERFNRFIITSQKENAKLDYDKFVEIIKEKAPGIDENELRKYYTRYEDGLDLVERCKIEFKF